MNLELEILDAIKNSGFFHNLCLLIDFLDLLQLFHCVTL